MNRWIKYALGGVGIGCASVVPGVSGGTIAVALGIYREIIEALSYRSIHANMRRTLLFFGTIACGALLGILLVARIMGAVLERFPLLGVAFFIGLMIGSIPHIFRSYYTHTLRWHDILIFIIGLGIVAMPKVLNVHIDDISVSAGEVSIFLLVVSGFVASAAMVLPGISGSLILLIFGTYAYILEAINTINIAVLVIFACAAGVGALLCAKMMRELFKRMPRHTWVFILGLVVGSIVFLWPQIPDTAYDVLLMAGLCVIGAVASYVLSCKN